MYVNAVPVDATESDWRNRAVKMCDGGILSFGAVFDVDLGGFDSFYFNAALSGRLGGGGW